MRIYPLKFQPILKEKVWGGRKLNSLLNKSTDAQNIGESWEISDVEGNVSEVANGVYKGTSLSNLLHFYKGDLLGEENYQTFGPRFPLLIKFLDANTNLSVQVHPDDNMANKYHNSYGKTEMWYIMESEKNAEIIMGVNEQCSNPEILSQINAENVTTLCNSEKVQKGDCYFIPAGKIHALGAGVLAAEIQQTSDVTYRVYDWDRRDHYGNSRELHTQKAIEATKLSPQTSKKEYDLAPNEMTSLVECDYFSTRILQVDESYTIDYKNLDSFVILMCVEGTAAITTDHFTETIIAGETILLPAICEGIELQSKEARFLEVYIPQATRYHLPLAS